MRLELRHGAARPTVYDVTSASFLVGTVPGCDLRLPGNALPAVCCLLTRHPGGVELRKLAPIQPLLVNGRPAAALRLADGDRIRVGAVELLVQITGAAAPEVVPLAVLVPDPVGLDERARRLERQEEDCRQQREAAEALRREVERQQRDVADVVASLEERERTLLGGRVETTEAAGAAEVARQQEDLDRVRRELADIRRQLVERYRQRRDRLSGMREALRRAARKMKERKQGLDAEARHLAVRREEVAVRQAELAAQADEIARRHQEVDEQRRLLERREEETGKEAARLVAACQARERSLAEEGQALAKAQTEHQTDLARLARAQAKAEEREQSLRKQALDVDHRFEQLQRDSREMEEQAAELDGWRTRLAADDERLAKARADQEAAAAQLAQRAAALEGQQAMLASLRTRLERMREEARRQEEQLAEGRARLEETEAGVKARDAESRRLRADLDAERSAHDQDRRRVEERGGVLESAVAQLRQTQETLSLQETTLRERERQAEAAARDQQENEGLLLGRAEQFRALQERLEAERQRLREREAALALGEQGVAALQEQLRRRSEELAGRQRGQEEQIRRAEEALAGLEARRAEGEAQRQGAETRLAAARQELDARTADLARREETLARHVERLKETGRHAGAERKAFAEEHARHEEERVKAEEALALARTQVEAARQEAAELRRQLPELEARATTAAERLTDARAQLREHLNELHGYARQGRDDLESLRAQIQADAERVRQQEQALHRERDEHRLAVAAFRQQLIDWQAQVTDMKRSMAQGETLLERRRAEVDEQARQVEDTSARLARQAEQLREQERRVAERRGEVEQHLEDMRQWYRRKLRELTGDRPAPGAGREDAREGILSLTGDVEPGDRQLGDLLRSMELVDADTLTALLAEARRQRRSLRQLLLAGGHLTLYQVALIEAGNLDGLMLGPVRLVDRLRGTPRESAYRVFDPRRGQEALLRHLSEEEGQDAVRPDEFRQRFGAAAAVRHPNLAETFEVLDVAGRPAVLQEWVTGLPGGDWPALAAVPGVWYRLLSQAALGLHTLHQAGLAHGHLTPELVVLTGDGLVKVCGAGEPGWLAVPPRGEDGDAANDLLALGTMAAAWADLGGRAKPLPGSLRLVLDRLTAQAPELRYPDAAALLEELERAGEHVPPNAAAWERLLRHVRDEAVATALRLSA